MPHLETMTIVLSTGKKITVNEEELEELALFIEQFYDEDFEIELDLEFEVEDVIH